VLRVRVDFFATRVAEGASSYQGRLFFSGRSEAIMRHCIAYVVVAGVAGALGCAEAGDLGPSAPTRAEATSQPAPNDLLPQSALVIHERIGNPLDDEMRGEGPGLVVLGGGPNVDDAYAWMRTTIGCTRRYAGDIVVLRANDDDSYAQYIADRDLFNSVQTIVVPLGATADDLGIVANILDRAEGVVLASEDPTEVLRWHGTDLAAAVQRAFDRGGVVAATGGGATVLGQFAHDTGGAVDSVHTSDAIANPYEKSIHFARDMFHFPQLEGMVVDTHFRQGDRFGRLSAFMARQVADGTLSTHPPRALGIGVDEGSALTIDRFGRFSLVQAPGAEGSAFILIGGTPQRIAPNAPLVYTGLVVARLDAPGEMFDLDRACGTAFVYTVSVAGGGGTMYSPPNPYEAQGVAHDCVY
jgi:cyanophycinase-like exopeptidase